MLRSRRAHVEEYLAGRGQYLNDPEGEAKQTAATQAVISGEMEPTLLVTGGETLSLGGTSPSPSTPSRATRPGPSPTSSTARAPSSSAMPSRSTAPPTASPGYVDPLAYRASLEYLRDEVRPQHLYLGHPYRRADGVAYGVELDAEQAQRGASAEPGHRGPHQRRRPAVPAGGPAWRRTRRTPRSPRRRGARLPRRPHARAVAVLHLDARLRDARNRSNAPWRDLRTTGCRRADDRRPQGPPGPDARRRRARRGRLPRPRGQAAAGPRGPEPLRQGAAGPGPHHAAADAPQPDVGRLHRGRRHRPRRRRGLRPRHRRPARLRRLRGRAHRQLQRRRRPLGPGRLRRHRVGRRAAVVRRQRRHDRHLLLRLDAGAGRRRASAAPQGDLRQRRPLRLLRDDLPRRRHVVHAARRPRGPRWRLRLGVHRPREVPHDRDATPRRSSRSASRSACRTRTSPPGRTSCTC